MKPGLQEAECERVDTLTNPTRAHGRGATPRPGSFAAIVQWQYGDLPTAREHTRQKVSGAGSIPACRIAGDATFASMHDPAAAWDQPFGSHGSPPLEVFAVSGMVPTSTQNGGTQYV